MEAVPGFIATGTGSRAGDAFGTVMFNILMSAALDMACTMLQDLGMNTTIERPAADDVLSDEFDLVGNFSFADISFVDDTVILLHSTSYALLRPLCAGAANGLSEIVSAVGMAVNFDRGKT